MLEARPSVGLAMALAIVQKAKVLISHSRLLSRENSSLAGPRPEAQRAEDRVKPMMLKKRRPKLPELRVCVGLAIPGLAKPFQ